MRYAKIIETDIANGIEVGTCLFVQGCSIHCFKCHNTSTWDFNGGYEWTNEIKNKFINLAMRDYIKRVTLTGGEVMAKQNADGVLDLIISLRELKPSLNIWVYTGYTFDQLRNLEHKLVIDQIMKQSDVMVIGPFVNDLRDITLAFRGSSNQLIIDSKGSYECNEPVIIEKYMNLKEARE